MKINLDKLTKSILRNLHTGREYQSLIFLADELRKNIRNKQVDRTSQWTTLRDTLLNEGKSDGIKLFLEAIKEIANQNEEK